MTTMICVYDPVKVIEPLIRASLYRHRESLGRAYSFPRDYAEAQRIAKFVCSAASIEIDQGVLYVEANKITARAGCELFPASDRIFSPQATANEAA